MRFAKVIVVKICDAIAVQKSSIALESTFSSHGIANFTYSRVQTWQERLRLCTNCTPVTKPCRMIEIPLIQILCDAEKHN